MAKESPHMPSLVAPDELRRRVREVNWFHTIDLGDGIVTEGRSQPALILPRLRLPDLTGKTVLDIGAWDGFYSFEAERRGAARVVATDSFSWGGAGWGTKAGFELAREALGSHVEDVEIDVMDLDPSRLGTFDVVLFLGVLYHMRDPLGALERAAAMTGGLLVVETEVGMLMHRRPAAAFYPGDELAGDHTNWWAPNPAAVLGMLRAVGFSDVEVAWRRSLPRRVAGWLVNRTRGSTDMSLAETMRRFRFVFHARR
jgi:tRNA (mo5U34)-methyltransferase